jgi:hypothetical protein
MGNLWPTDAAAIAELQAEIDALETGKINVSERAAANGVATLDSSTKVPINELPDAILGALKFKGLFNGATGIITSADPAINGQVPPAASSANEGWFFITYTDGNYDLDGIDTWVVGDWPISIGTAWSKIDNTDSVSSVNGQTGAVSLDSDDISEGATNLYFTATRVRSVVLTGLSVATDAAIAATDTILEAFGKLQAQVTSRFLKAGDTLTGTGGAGFYGAIPQSSQPATPASGFRLFANSVGKLAWIGTNGFLRVFDGTANTADRTYTLPDSSGTVVTDTTFPTVDAAAIHAATDKATPVDADELPLVDSAASNVLKKLTIANLIAKIKTYFDTLYGTPIYTYASGYYYCGQQTIADSTLTPGYLGMYGIYFCNSKSTTFDRICLEVTAAVASSTVRLGIYSTVNNWPSTLVLDAGTIDSSSTGTKEITISQTLPAGVYILAAVCQGGGASATVRSRLAATGPIIAPATSSGTGNVCSFTVAGAISGAFASTYTWSPTTQSNTPKIMLRAA